ncbi:MAG: hypothetical protein EOP04_03280 [Proteobacteria bacterium]|nr:MAG: hypothetical protein EOP04_03280 [Pseudomonadota bacterium]
MFSLKSSALLLCLATSPVFAQSGNAGSGNTNGSSGNGNASGNGSGNTVNININIGCIFCGGGSGKTEAKGWHPPMVSKPIDRR